MLVAPSHRPPICRAITFLTILAVLAIALLPGCASSSKGKRRAGRAESGGSPPMEEPKETRHASYGVTWMNGEMAGEGSYRLAYVMKEGGPLVIESESGGFRGTSGTDQAGDAVRGDKIRSYLLMSPIRAIIGDRTDFVVGQTYDGIVMEGGKSLFKYTCDRDEEIAGMKGQRLTIRTAKKGTPELELVLSKEYPFPLYIKEHTGQEPLQIFLKDGQ